MKWLVEKILEKTACLIPAGWQYPGIACAKIVIDDSEFRTKNFTESAWKQSAPIKVSESVMGKIEVGYLEERPELDDGPFLNEERLLIDAIAERLGHITERKKAEETQKRLVAIIEATPDFVGFADAKDKHIIYVNKAGRKMCGIGNDEDVTKLNISDVHPEWTNKMFAEEILPAAVRDGVWTGECAFLDIRDRHEIPVSMVLSSHKASNGEVEVFSTISRDITERKRAKALVKASEEKYRSLVQNIPDVVWTTDQNGRTAFISSNVKKIYGYTPEEIIEGGDEVWFGRIHPDDIERVKKTYTELFEKEDLFDIEYRTKRKDGEWIWLHDRAMAVYEKNGLKYADGIFKDITERKKAEEALRESEERYKNLFKANIDGMLIADATTKKFRYANPAICRMLGYSEEELTQMGVADIHPKDSLEQVLAEFEAQSSGAKITAKDLQCVRKDGQVISVSINASTVMIDQTKYLLGIFRDITERKNKEKLILDANRRLEKVSEELSAAKRDLEQKNEALQKVCSELQQRVKEQTAQLAAAK